MFVVRVVCDLLNDRAVLERRRLLEDLDDGTSADGASTLAHGKTESLVHRGGALEGNLEEAVISGHDHLLALIGNLDGSGDISSTNEELGRVAIKARGVATTLLLGKNVDLALELGVLGDGARVCDDLSTADVLALDTTEKDTDVVSSLTTGKGLLVHLDTSAGGADLGPLATDDLDFLTGVDAASLNTSSHDGSASRDREGVLNGEKEGLVEVTLRLGDEGVDVAHELEDGILADRVITALNSGKGGATNDRGVITREVVVVEKLTDLHLHNLEELLIVDLVDLVEEDNEGGHTNLLGEKQVLTGLGHGAVGGRDDKDTTVHGGSTGNHVLDVIGVAGAVNVGVVAGVGGVLDVGGGDGDTTGTLFGGLVNGGIVHKGGVLRVGLSEHLGNSGGQGGLAVVNVANGADVAVGQRAHEVCHAAGAQRGQGGGADGGGAAGEHGTHHAG